MSDCTHPNVGDTIAHNGQEFEVVRVCCVCNARLSFDVPITPETRVRLRQGPSIATAYPSAAAAVGRE